MTRTVEELTWLKSAWFLANCGFRLSESPGFEAHRKELQAFEKAWDEYYRSWENDNIWDLYQVESMSDMEDIELYIPEIKKLQEAKERVWTIQYLQSIIDESNDLGMSPRQTDRYLVLEKEVAQLKRELLEYESKEIPF